LRTPQISDGLHHATGLASLESSAARMVQINCERHYSNFLAPFTDSCSPEQALDALGRGIEPLKKS
jgi:hypothetical protein